MDRGSETQLQVAENVLAQCSKGYLPFPARRDPARSCKESNVHFIQIMIITQVAALTDRWIFNYDPDAQQSSSEDGVNILIKTL